MGFVLSTPDFLGVLQMDFMLEMICDIKNNKKRPTENAVQHTRIKKWLQEVLSA